MGRPDHYRQGPDTDPLQAGDHHVGFCRLQYRTVRAVLDHRARWTFLRGRDPAQPLRRMDPGQDREASGAVGGAVCRRARDWFYRRISNVLNSSVKRFAGLPLGVTLEIMPDRPVNPSTLSRTHLATLGVALLMAMIAGDVAWPQSAPQPSSAGVEAPALQTAPDRTEPQPSEPAPPPAPPPEENPGLLNEMGKLFEKSLSI